MRTSVGVRLGRPVGSTWTASDFETVHQDLPAPSDGELLVENTWLSVDASVALRLTGGGAGYFPAIEPGEPIGGWAVGRVVESRSDRFPVGRRVLHHEGWRDLSLLDAGLTGWGGPEPLPDDGVADEHHLGALGPTGLTAWAGLLHVGALAPGDVVYVSAAAGSVGSLVVQLALARGHTVVASTGSAAKVELLRRWGATAFDHHDAPVEEQLSAAAPDGVDVYFDNVGGDHLEAALATLRPAGRVVLCGAVSTYGSGARPETGPRNLFEATAKGLTLRGFLARDFADDRERCRDELRPALLAGRLDLPLHVVDGVEQAPRALEDLLTGRSTGKVLVHVTSTPQGPTSTEGDR